MKLLELLDTTLKDTLFHGGIDFDGEFRQDMSRSPNDYFGGGVAYFTDNHEVALKYAKNAGKRSGKLPVVYNVKLTIKNNFDVDKKYNSELFLDSIKDLDKFIRNSSIGEYNDPIYVTKQKLKSGIEITGKSIFKGLSNNHQNSGRAREILIDLGFDGLRYTGDEDSMNPYNVWLPYNSDQVSIVKKDFIDRPSVKIVVKDDLTEEQLIPYPENTFFIPQDETEFYHMIQQLVSPEKTINKLYKQDPDSILVVYPQEVERIKDILTKHKLNFAFGKDDDTRDQDWRGY